MSVLSALLLAATLRGVTVENDTARLAVDFRAPDVVHFRAAPAGAPFEDPARKVTCGLVATADAECPAVAGEIVRDDAALTLSSSALRVRVDRATLAFSVWTADGTRVFASADRPFAFDGRARKASFRRDVRGVERFFGLGNVPGRRFEKLDHRDTVYDLWLSDDNVHAVIPLWYSSQGYGLYACSSNRGQVDFTEGYSLSLEAGEMDFYFLWGPSFKRILGSWSELAGRMRLPPRYALGLTYRGFGGWRDEDLVRAVTAQQEAGIRLDVVGVEPGWHTWAYPCSFVWSEKFPDPCGFIARMHGLGLKVNLWEHPYVSTNAPFRAAIGPYGLDGADVGTREWENGTKYKYGFGGFIPDMTMPEARDVYWNHHKAALVDLGVDGFKVDETDSFSANRSTEKRFPGGLSCNAYHNLLGTLTVNLLHERYRRDFNRRTFAFSRGNTTGMQRWATSAYTDFYGFDQFVMSLIAQSYSGTYYTPEIRTPESTDDGDYVRRAQMMFLTPFPQSNEWMKPVGVMDRSAAVIQAYRTYNRIHYLLVPYLYSLFREQSKTGLGVVRALPFEFQDDPRVFDLTDTFMLGPSILVHPVADASPSSSVTTYLPAGADWLDWPSMSVCRGGTPVTRTYRLDEMPIFIRCGSIVPVSDYGRTTDDPTGPLILAVFPSERPTSFTLYEDDGISFDYEKGAFAETTITARQTGGRVSVALGKRTGGYVSGRKLRLAVRMPDGKTRTVDLAGDGQAHEISLEPDH